MTRSERVSPSTIAEAAAVLADAASEGTAVGFRGSGARRDLGGRLPTDVVMDTSSMTSVIDWLVEDLTIVVEAGITVGELETLLKSENQTSHLPADEAGRTVGGLISEGASGLGRLKYGPTRDRVLETTVATGYGQVVRGGGRLVKNVTGYDMPRLMTGSLGSLGFIGSVCLKLWPLPPTRRVVPITDPELALRELYRPVSVVETDLGSFVIVEGSTADVDSQALLVSGSAVDVDLPRSIQSPIMISVRVPPASLAGAVARIKTLAPTRYIAQHGVGVIDVGFESVAPVDIEELRTGIESQGGSLVVVRPGDALNDVEPWGTPPSTLSIQSRLKELFDPARICNPGVLPGGL